ncbi:hypothetical protein NPIL_346291 [Nephila pilipes]|uniref:Uncharacterized protein n=1 Tax=Nephila pilipes TaxID=299642 RepID=A0A8X6J5J0_NEPPI|nr:hypothetical protein NPIL_346291 [Nephila pilipes]
MRGWSCLTPPLFPPLRTPALEKSKRSFVREKEAFLGWVSRRKACVTSPLSMKESVREMTLRTQMMFSHDFERINTMVPLPRNRR